MSAIDLATAKVHLGIEAGDTTHDAQLQVILDGAQGVIEGLVGPLTATSYTESYSGGGYYIITRHVPVIAVQSLTENWGPTQYTLTNQPVGQSTDQWGYDIEDPQAGKIIRRTSGGYPFPFFPGVGNVLITYTAGRTDLPAAIENAMIRQLRDLWSDYQSGRTSRGGQRQPMPYGVSNMVTELLQPFMLQPGIA